MTAHQKESKSPSEADSECNTRKRVCKACDRCRLKKSKCDGASPCNRCQSDNAICVFGERKKTHDKVYPKGYVEMLEQQQEKLVNAMRDMYDRLEKCEAWPGDPLQRTEKGFALTHDILERLGLLNLPSDEYDEPFEDNPHLILNRMMLKTEENPYPTPNTIKSEYSPRDSEILDLNPSSSFGGNMGMPLQPTPPLRTPEEHSLGMDSSMNLDLSTQYAWLQPQNNYVEGANIYPYDVAPTYDGSGFTQQERVNPCLPAWSDDLGYTGFGEVLT